MELRGVIKIMTLILSIRPTFWFQTNRDKRLKLYWELRWENNSVSQTRTCKMQSAEKKEEILHKSSDSAKMERFWWMEVSPLFKCPTTTAGLKLQIQSVHFELAAVKVLCPYHLRLCMKNKSPLQNAAHQNHVQPLKSVKSDSLPDWGTAWDVFLEPGSLGMRTMECWEDV